MKKKISFSINKDIANHPHFHMDFLKLVAKYEDSKDVICSHCNHRLFDHLKSGQNGYCMICYKKDNTMCPTLKKYFEVQKR